MKRVEDEDARTFARATRLVGTWVDDEADDDDKGAVDVSDPRRDVDSDIVSTDLTVKDCG